MRDVVFWFGGMSSVRCSFFFFNDTATTEIYTLSLHDALPISGPVGLDGLGADPEELGDLLRRLALGDKLQHLAFPGRQRIGRQDRKSTRLNSSHSQISYAVFCLKKKKNKHHADLPLHTPTQRL